MTNQSHVAAARRLWRQKLGERGFTRQRGDVFTIDVGPGVHGWLGLNTASHRGDSRLGVNPMVGVHNADLERRLCSLTGEAYDHTTPSIATNLGYTMPNPTFRQWLLDSESYEIAIDDMLGSVASHGIQFMQSLRETSALVALMRSGKHGIPDQLQYRTAVGLMLLGQIDEVRQFLRERLTALSSERHPAAERFRRFAQALSAEIA